MTIGTFIKGDSITLECNLNQNIDNWKIRCEIYEEVGQSVKLATANSGGSDDQIKITSSTTGIFKIYVPKDATKDFCDENNRAFIEIEIETNDSPSKKYTVLQDELELKDQTINWSTPS
jgi:hypothetical protein